MFQEQHNSKICEEEAYKSYISFKSVSLDILIFLILQGQPESSSTFRSGKLYVDLIGDQGLEVIMERFNLRSDYSPSTGDRRDLIIFTTDGPYYLVADVVWAVHRSCIGMADENSHALSITSPRLLSPQILS